MVFFERDVPWQAGARDLAELPGGELVLYPDRDAIRVMAPYTPSASASASSRDVGTTPRMS
ncbi:hypothetical protein GCM10028796_56370 [Ramlibacter monticola]|uniref:Uncharacterized protein n=1 Tax=Ramlibacter monticola TaxID=1926872 RepID=A0A936Z4Q6_9BURK|nr:hypothetical protein [Ramlibacter monticola]MBL0395120.1 hypothetical protein [Ramlibacter monticola]